jgi:hypothetical protein
VNDQEDDDFWADLMEETPGGENFGRVGSWWSEGDSAASSLHRNLGAIIDTSGRHHNPQPGLDWAKAAKGVRILRRDEMAGFGSGGYLPGSAWRKLTSQKDWDKADMAALRPMVLERLGVTEAEVQLAAEPGAYSPDVIAARQKLDEAILEFAESGGRTSILARALGWGLSAKGGSSPRIAMALNRAKAARAKSSSVEMRVCALDGCEAQFPGIHPGKRYCSPQHKRTAANRLARSQ